MSTGLQATPDAGLARLAADEKALWKYIDAQARDGFPREQGRLNDCIRVLDYYELRGRDRLNGRVDQDKPRVSLPLAHRVVDILCSHLYSPGPSRKMKGGDDDWLQQVYRDNLMNSVMQEADVLSTLMGIAAVQAAETGDPNMPIKLQLWGYNQLILYPDAVDSTVIAHVVTVDRLNERTRYTWWSRDEKRTYMTDELTPGQTSGGRTPRYIPELSEPNPYGRLPFGFVHYKLPTRHYMVEGLGEYLADVNEELDCSASSLFYAVERFQAPEGYIYNAPSDWQPDRKVGELTRVTGLADEIEGYAEPRIEYPQPNLDVQSGWDHVQRAIDVVLEGLGVPQTAYRMTSATLPSGAALVAEQQPLIDYAEGRQEPFRKYEADIAAAILAVGGRGTPDSGIDLTCRWPIDLITTPGPEQDVQDQASLDMDAESLPMVVMRRFKLQSEDEAWEHLAKVAEDNEKLRTLGLGPLAAQDRAMEQQQQAAEHEHDLNQAADPAAGDGIQA